MPKVKTNKAYEKSYSEDDVLRALESIRNGMSQRKATQEFGVPRSTLQFRVSDKFRNKTSHGPNPVLSPDEESRIEEWISVCQRNGFPVRIEAVQDSVKRYLDEHPRQNPFVNNRPGRGWCRAFFKRHTNVTLRTPEGVTAASSNISENDIRKWFVGVEEYLNEKGYSDILKDPSRVFNGDETSFLLCPKNKKVLAVRGTKNVYQIEHNPKVNLTVMFTFSASGETTAPMIIYPYKRLPSGVLKSVPDGWGIGCSDSGWMRSELFFEYIGNVFYKYLVSKNTKFPIILFVDGHKTHLTLQTSQLCSDLKIILVALYPNATRIMQPADVSAFRPLKANWNRAVLKFRQDNPNSIITKENFAIVLKEAVNNLKAESISNGFRATGLYPWQPSAIDFSKCLGKVSDQNLGENKNLVEEASITYSEFLKIVGEKTILMFKNGDIKNENENLQLLHNIHTAFENKIIDNPKTKLDKSLSYDVETFNIDELPIIIDDTIVPDIVSPILQRSSPSNTFNNNQITDNPLLTNKSFQTENDNQIDEFFFWPKTPERKGKRQSEKLPFVLTSSVRKNAEKLKMEEKLQKELQKEERKRKRLEKQNTIDTHKKQTSKLLVSKTKIEKAMSYENVIHKKAEKSIPSTNNGEIDSTILKRGLRVHLPKIKPSSINEDISDLSDVNSEKNTSFAFESAVDEMDQNTPLKIGRYSVPNTTKRNLFSSEECTPSTPKNSISIISDILIRSSDSEDFFPKSKVYTGLCYTCVLNITKSKVGVKCQFCLRSYHIVCAPKRSETEKTDYFLCCTCQLKFKPIR